MKKQNVAVTLRVTSPAQPIIQTTTAHRIGGSLPIHANPDGVVFSRNPFTPAMPHHTECDGYVSELSP